MIFTLSKNIQDNTPLMNGLYEDFGEAFFSGMLRWCDVVQAGKRRGTGTDVFWQVWIISEALENAPKLENSATLEDSALLRNETQENKTIGVCGLYSLEPHSTAELWLGWFGILPAYRNRKLGSRVLDWLKVEAAQNGAQSLYSYIDKNRRALPFYQRNGFQVLETVGQYMANNNLDPEDFEDPMDLVIQFELGEKPGK